MSPEQQAKIEGLNEELKELRVALDEEVLNFQKLQGDWKTRNSPYSDDSDLRIRALVFEMDDVEDQIEALEQEK